MAADSGSIRDNCLRVIQMLDLIDVVLCVFLDLQTGITCIYKRSFSVKRLLLILLMIEMCGFSGVVFDARSI